jgi:hypothetical protein
LGDAPIWTMATTNAGDAGDAGDAAHAKTSGCNDGGGLPSDLRP